MSCNCWPSKTKVRMVGIEKVREEFKGNKTFYINEKMEFKPGQFALVWVPEVDEKPIALIPNGKKYALNIEAKGKATEKMMSLKKGDRIGVRGPYGRGFSTDVKKAVIVAGGVGIDSIVKLAEDLKEKDCDLSIILGGRNKERIVFEKELKKTGKVYITTDDGSYGEKGFNVQVLERLLKGEKFEKIYACGPEVMMVKAFEIAERNKVEFEGSLERYMKCGIGVCGQCVVNDKLTCSDGPVFSGDELREMSEFGKEAYLKSGRKVSLKEYYGWRE